MATRFCFSLLLLWQTATQAQPRGTVPDEMGQPVDVALPHVATGVLPQHVFVDPEGRYAAIFGQDKPTDPKSRRIDLYHGVPTTLTVIDLKDLRVLRREKVSGDIRDAFLDGQQLFWVPKNVNLLHRLEFESDKPVEQHPFSDPILQVLPIGEEFLAIFVVEHGKARAKVFRRNNMKPISDHPLTTLEIGEFKGRGNQRVRVAYPIGDGLVSLRGLWLINQNNGTTRCLVSRFYGTTHLIHMKTSGPSGTLRPGGKYAWKRSVFPAGVSKFQGARLYNWRGQGSQWDVSRTYPFAAVLELSGGSEETKLIVQLKDLVTGQVVRENSWRPAGSVRDVRNHYSTYFVRTAGRRVLTTFGDKAYLDEIPKQVLDDLEIPLRLLYPQAALGSASKPMIFTLKADGGTPPYSFRLTKTLDGIRLDEKSGQVKIELPVIWKSFVNEVAAGKRRDLATTMQMAKAGLSSFDRDTGVKITQSQYGVGLPLWFEVTDSAGQDDQMFINIPVVGPKQAIESALESGQHNQLQISQERRERYMKNRVEQLAHNRLARFGLGEFWFFASQAIVYGIYLVVAVWYVWPWMARQQVSEALTPICLITAIRVIGTSLLLPGVLEEKTLTTSLTFMAIADAVATVLGVIGAALFYRRSAVAIPIAWVITLCGLADTFLCYYAYMKVAFTPAVVGSAYLVPVFAPTPAPVAYLLLITYLVRRPDRNIHLD